MKQYIDKSAVLAEIEKRLGVLSQLKKASYEIGLYDAYKIVLSLLDTFEVKEVDLDKEYEEFVEEDPVYSKLVNGIVGKAIAKYFFELGLKAQKGE